MKDLTKIKKPFGMLKPKVQDRITAHGISNGLVEIYIGDKWEDCASDRFDYRFTYRAKPTENKTVAALREEFKPITLTTVFGSTDPHPIFAAVKEWQEARAYMDEVYNDRKGDTRNPDWLKIVARVITAESVVMAIKMPE